MRPEGTGPELQKTGKETGEWHWSLADTAGMPQRGVKPVPGKGVGGSLEMAADLGLSPFWRRDSVCFI